MERDYILKLQQKVTSLRAEGKYEDSINNGNKLLAYGMQLKDYKSVLTAYINLAASYYCIGDIETALNFMTKHEEICELYGDEFDKLNSFNVLFLLHEYNKDYYEALETLEKSINLGKKLKKYNIVSNGYSNYSHVCMINGDLLKALQMAHEGYEMAKKHMPSSPILEFRVKLNIAKAYIGLGNLADSGKLIKDMITEPFLKDFIREKAECYDLLGNWYKIQNLYNEAFESYSTAKDLIESYHDVYLLKTVQEERCKLCELMNNFELGYQIQKEYITLLDEINKRELELTALKLKIKRNVTSLKKAVNTDFLTGTYSRKYLEAATNSWLENVHERNENIACIVFDIDGFKNINDTYGHLFGDEIIKEVSRVSSTMLKPKDLIGRYGGDEFVIILKGASLDDSRMKAKQIIEAIRNLKVMRDGISVPVTISIGITATVSNKITNFYDLFNSADIEMYKAKQNGKNRISII